MPWCEIEKDRVQHLSLFGYTILKHETDGVWVMHPEKGRLFVRYEKPIIWAEDTSEAVQIGAITIYQSSKK